MNLNYLYWQTEFVVCLCLWLSTFLHWGSLPTPNIYVHLFYLLYRETRRPMTILGLLSSLSWSSSFFLAFSSRSSGSTAGSGSVSFTVKSRKEYWWTNRGEKPSTICVSGWTSSDIEGRGLILMYSLWESRILRPFSSFKCKFRNCMSAYPTAYISPLFKMHLGYN